MNWNEIATLLMIAEKLGGHPNLKALKARVNEELDRHEARVAEADSKVTPAPAPVPKAIITPKASADDEERRV